MDLNNKKIGIWGFGVVGKSATKYLINKFFAQTTKYKQETTNITKELKQVTTSDQATTDITQQLKHTSSSEQETPNIIQQLKHTSTDKQNPKLKKQQQLQLQILDQRELTEQEKTYLENNSITFVNQNNTENFDSFLKDNDLVIPSPGIDLRKYKKYAHKFISEFDLFQQELHIPIIGITGTVGKTTITHMLDQIIKAQGINIWTGGNIGTPVLDVISQETHKEQSRKIDLVLLELSSFQLELCKAFAPDLAIWTNFFPNHLDKHSDMQEYFMAKLQMLVNQTHEQCALLPISLINQLQPFLKDQALSVKISQKQISEITHNSLNIKSQLYFFSENKPSQELINKLRPQDTLFYLENNNVIKLNSTNLFTKTSNSIIGSITELENLAEFTFHENLLIIFCSLYIFSEIANKILALSDANCKNTQNLVKLANFQSINYADIPPMACQVEHRLEKVASINDIVFYNDSKATTIASTTAAVIKLTSKNKPIILILGGLSKGVDRSPLIESIKNNIKLVISFGKEADIIKDICNKENVPCQSFKITEAASPEKATQAATCKSSPLNYALNKQINAANKQIALEKASIGTITLEKAINASFKAAIPGDQILFSPSGSSYDLFKDYVERGCKFKSLVLELANKNKK